MIELIKPFGFTSFLQLWEYLIQERLTGEKDVRIERVYLGNVQEGLTLDLDYIKSRAFEELYDRLPTKEDIETIGIGLDAEDAQGYGRYKPASDQLDKIPIKFIHDAKDDEPY